MDRPASSEEPFNGLGEIASGIRRKLFSHEADHGMLFADRRSNDAGGILMSLFFPAPFHLLRQGDGGPTIVMTHASYSLASAFSRYELITRDGVLLEGAREFMAWAQKNVGGDQVWATPLIHTSSSLDTALSFANACA